MRSLLSVVSIIALLGFVLTDTAAGQVRRVPNTGCRNAPYPNPVGSPAIGSGFGVQCPPSSSLAAPFLVLGLRTANVVIAPPVACGGPCVLLPRPEIVLPGVSAWRVLIPNDPRLVGVCFGVQCGEVDRQNSCVRLSGALQVCITR